MFIRHGSELTGERIVTSIQFPLNPYVIQKEL